MQDNSENYDIEVLSGNESAVIEMVRFRSLSIPATPPPGRRPSHPTLAIFECRTDFVDAL